jgi:hypothetical protein
MRFYGMLRMEECRELAKTFVPTKEAIAEVCIKFNIAAYNMYSATDINSVKLVVWNLRRSDEEFLLLKYNFLRIFIH